MVLFWRKIKKKIGQKLVRQEIKRTRSLFRRITDQTIQLICRFFHAKWHFPHYVSVDYRHAFVMFHPLVYFRFFLPTDIAKMRLLKLLHMQALGYPTCAPFQLSEYVLGKNIRKTSVVDQSKRMQWMAASFIEWLTKWAWPDFETSEYALFVKLLFFIFLNQAARIKGLHL